MSFRMNNLYDFQAREDYYAHVNIFNTLGCLSLDACVPFYRERLFLPSTLPDDFRFVLQKNLERYTLLQAEESRWKDGVIEKCLRDVAARYGDLAARHLGMWVAIASDTFGYEIIAHMEFGVLDTSRYNLSLNVPFAVSRFDTIREFIAATAPDDWEKALAPAALKTRWDKKFYAAHYDPRPDDECNTWEPNESVYWICTQMCGRLAWESVGKFLADAEFAEINQWIVQVGRMVRSPSRKWVDVRKLLLPEELRRYYDEQGLLLKYPPK